MKLKQILMGAMLLLMLFCGVAVITDSNIMGAKAIIVSAMFFAGALATAFLLWVDSKEED